MTQPLPPEIRAIIDRATAQGYEVEVVPEAGRSVVFSGESVGAAQTASGDGVKMTVDGSPQVVDAATGTASGGGFVGTFSGDALQLPSGPTPYLVIPGVLCLGLAAFAGYRARVGLALVVGAFGAGLIGGAFYPLAFVISAIALAGGAVLYFRGDLRRGLVEQAFARTAAIVETDAPELKDKIRKTTPAPAKKAAGKVLKREGVS